MRWARLVGSRAQWTPVLLLGFCQFCGAQWLNLKTYPAPGAGQDITAGPDGALWYTDFVGGKIGRVTTSGSATEYSCSVGGNSCVPHGITTGPDGALWFTSSDALGLGSFIGRITTSGAVTLYALSTGAALMGIAAGPDGALWFTEYSNFQLTTNKIGRITTSGAISEYPLPTDCGQPNGGCSPFWITAGPDGGLWFIQLGPRLIGRITTAGAITEYPISYPTTSTPKSVTAGPDGAVWFVETIPPSGVPQIGRITPAGALTEYPLPSAQNSAGAITSGPDGALWTSSAYYIYRMTSAGFATLYNTNVIGKIVYPGTATTGSDGALWWVDPQGVVRTPACGLGLSATFANTTLNLGFVLGVNVPATWLGGYYSNTGLTGLWSKALPAVAPPASFTVSWGPGFPSIGNIGVVSALQDQSTGQFLCAEWQIVNTGGSGATAEELERRIRDSLPQPRRQALSTRCR